MAVIYYYLEFKATIYMEHLEDTRGVQQKGLALFTTDSRSSGGQVR